MFSMSELSTSKHSALLAMVGNPVTTTDATTIAALFAAESAARAQQHRHITPHAYFRAQQQLAANAAANAAASNSDFFGFSSAASRNSESAFLQAALVHERAEKQMIINQLAALNQTSVLNTQASALTPSACISPEFSAQLQALSQIPRNVNPHTANSILLQYAAANQQAAQQAQELRVLAAATAAVNNFREADILAEAKHTSLLLHHASFNQELLSASRQQDLTNLVAAAASGNYKDASRMPDPISFTNRGGPEKQGRRGGAAEPFPQKIHRMLADLERLPGGTDIASFLPHGRAFSIHNPKTFVGEIMPRYFRMSRFSSFQRQLNLYDFKRITDGRDKGAYYHELFLHSRPALCSQMKRTKIKGQNSNWIGQGNFQEEVNFYSLPPVQASAADAKMVVK